MILGWMNNINNLTLEIKIFGIIVYSIGIPLCFYLYFKLQQKLKEKKQQSYGITVEDV